MPKEPEVTWTVSGGSNNRKAPFTPKHKITKEMDDSQRAGSERWNLLVEILQENGLMEER